MWCIFKLAVFVCLFVSAQDVVWRVKNVRYSYHYYYRYYYNLHVHVYFRQWLNCWKLSWNSSSLAVTRLTASSLSQSDYDILYPITISHPVPPNGHRLLPESPRWLLLKGKTQSALKVLRSAARVNKRPQLSDLEESSTERKEEGDKSKVNVKDILRQLCTSPRLLVRTLIINFNWWVAHGQENGYIIFTFSLRENEVKPFIS